MSEFLSIAEKAALSAGELVRGHLQEQHVIQCKGGFDFVTEVDRLSEGHIRKIISDAFPTHGFFCEEQVSEETVDEKALLHRLEGYTWVIDALDGTSNFIRGIPQFAVSIALVHDGEVIAGVVYDPSRGELFSAEKGGGAMLNHKPIRVGQVRELKSAIVSFGFPAADFQKRSETLEMAKRIAMNVGSFRIFNCAALLLCYVAAGRTDLSFEQGLHLWDMAAGALMVKEAGGDVTCLNGSGFTIFSTENLAGNAVLRQQFLECQR